MSLAIGPDGRPLPMPPGMTDALQAPPGYGMPQMQTMSYFPPPGPPGGSGPPMMPPHPGRPAPPMMPPSMPGRPTPPQMPQNPYAQKAMQFARNPVQGIQQGVQNYLGNQNPYMPRLQQFMQGVNQRVQPMIGQMQGMMPQRRG